MNIIRKFFVKCAIKKRKRKRFIQKRIESLQEIQEAGVLHATCLVILQELHMFGENHFRKQILKIQKTMRTQ